MNQKKPSQSKRILGLLSDYQPHCSNEMREMFIADPPRRINDLEEQGYIIKKEYCSLHSYHDGLPKMYTLVSKPTLRSELPKGWTGGTRPVEPPLNPFQPETPRRIENIASQTTRTNTGNYAYYKPEPTTCCPIYKASKLYHAGNCETQKQIHS